MNQVDCESICLAAMAVADGEEPPLPAAAIEAHLAQCADCRSEVELLKALMTLLDDQRRRERTESVEEAVAEALIQKMPKMQKMPNRGGRRESDHWLWFLLLGLLLAGGRVLATASDWKPDLWIKVIPILVAVAVFGLLRENPFRINTELQARTSDANLIAR